MNRIVKKEYLNPEVIRIEVEAPRIARRWRAGQFVVLRALDTGERFPLTIVDANGDAGTVTLIYQVVGRSTEELARLGVDEGIRDVLGPLGRPTDIREVGTVAAVGGGVGVALLYPIARAMRETGNHILSVLGARTKGLLILREEMAALSDRIEVVTDDGSSGRRGLVTDPLRDLLEAGTRIDQVVTVGPAVMMKAVVDLTRPLGIPTLVSLNPIMVDGTGMCGGCRVTVGGETKFACVDGPEFDGLQVDFDELMHRQQFYREEESHSLHHCRISRHRKA